MNPNDTLAALNITISIAMFLFCLTFFFSLSKREPSSRVGRVFVIVFGVASFFFGLDYGTTGVLRLVDIVAFPHVPHSLLPDFSLFPVGITLLIAWRIILSITLWALLIYILVIKQGRQD